MAMSDNDVRAERLQGIAETLQGYLVQGEAFEVTREAYRESLDGRAVERETEIWVGEFLNPGAGGDAGGGIVPDLEIISLVQQTRARMDAMRAELEVMSDGLAQVERLVCEELVDEEDEDEDEEEKPAAGPAKKGGGK